MKKLLFSFLLFTISSSSDAQSLYRSCFNYCMYLPIDYNYYGIKVIEAGDHNGSLALIQEGLLNVTYQRGRSIFLTRFDSTGAEIWNKVVNTPNNSIYINNVIDTFINVYQIPFDLISSGTQDYLISSVQDSIGYFIDTLGNSSSFDTTNLVITKLDNSGGLIWSTAFETVNSSCPIKILEIDNFIYLLSLKSKEIGPFGNSTIDSIFYLTKLDSTGLVLWSKEFNGVTSSISKIDFSGNSNYLHIATATDSTLSITQTDTAGNVLWSYDYNDNCRVNFATLLNSGKGCALAYGRSLIPHSILLKLDSSSAIVKAKELVRDTTFGTTHFFDYGNNKFAMLQSSDSSIYGPGGYVGSRHKVDLWVMDSIFNPQDHRQLWNYINYNSSNSEYILNIVKSKVGLLSITQCYTYSHPTSSFLDQPVIQQSDSIGYGCYSNPIPILNNVDSDIVLYPSPNNITSVATSYSILSSTIVVYDSLLVGVIDCSQHVGLENLNNSLPLVDIHPNPFHANAVISVSAIEPGDNLYLRIYNIMGKLFRTVQVTDLNTQIDRNGMSDGMYFYVLENASKRMASGKFIVE